MRFRSLLAALLALALLAGCSDDDDDGGAASDDTAVDVGDDDTPEITADGGEEPATDAELQAAIETTQLEAEDLGEGWTLTGTKPAGEDAGDDAPNPLEDCVDDLGDRFDDAQLAETEERSFERQGEAPIPQQLTSSSVALDDGALFTEMHGVLRDDAFGACMATAFEQVMSETTPEGAEITLGDIIQADTVVDPGDDADLESTGIAIPVTVTAEGITLETSVSIMFISTGQVGASLLFFGPVTELGAEEQAEFGRIVAERLSAAA